MSRKIIGVLAATPETIYATRILDAIGARCQAYGYDVAVISTLCDISLFQKKYLDGEKNIYNLTNFDRLDGVIVDSLSLMDSTTRTLIPEIPQMLREKCRKPVVSLGPLLPEYPSFITHNQHILKDITSHVIDVHGCRKLYCLTGPQGDADATDRLAGFQAAVNAHGIPQEETRVFYGDFWFPGGAELGRKIVSGEVPMPQAVICASDHMALGLTNYLTKHGVRVPEDIIVTGFDATPEGSINPVTITSAVPDYESVIVSAIDALRSQIEPDAPILPYAYQSGEHLRLGMSCGCSHDIGTVMDQMRESFYNVNQDLSDGNLKIDMGVLLESSMMEALSDTASPQECIYQIYMKTYLMGPYDEFFLCLDEKWLQADQCCKTGYPQRIKMVLTNDHQPDSGHYENGPSFETSLMLPSLGSEAHEPSMFYFMPVHFLDQSMGYAVLRFELGKPHHMTCVIRNWLKNVNSGLHISRTAHRLESLSTRDGMTGAYNRRGMELMLDHMLRKAAPEDNVLAFVIDMDRLKQINDTFGHADGDFGINAICSAAMSITRDNELCVRAGGDEFYVIGIGAYDPAEAEKRIAGCYEALGQINTSANKPYTLSASIGSACIPLASGMTVMGIIRIADAKMYENKVQKKMQRKD